MKKFSIKGCKKKRSSSSSSSCYEREYCDDISTNFDKKTSSKWEFDDPSGYAKCSIDCDLEICLPAGQSTNSDTTLVGPRYTRPVNNPLEFVYGTKLLTGVLHKFHGQGLVFETDDNTFGTFEVYSDGINAILRSKVVVNNVNVAEESAVLGPAPSQVPYYLRLYRFQNDFALFYSPDDFTWASLPTMVVQNIVVNRVGVYAWNGDDANSPGVVSAFAYFREI